MPCTPANASTTGYSTAILVYAFAWIRRLRGRKDEPSSEDNADERSDVSDDNLNVNYKNAFEISVNIGVIAFVEMTLKWNNITGVHSLRDPGQFMPFLIALAQLLAIIYQGVSKVLHLTMAEDGAGFDGEHSAAHMQAVDHYGLQLTALQTMLTRLGANMRIKESY